MRFAVAALEGANIVDLEDEGEQARYRSARSGPVPRVLACASLTDELEAAAALVKEWLGLGIAPETVGVLVRDAHQAQLMTRGLQEREVTVRRVDRSTDGTGRPLLMTMHRAKGMEFSRVLVAGVNADLVPADYVLRGLSDSDRTDALLRERSLLYVAITRARDELVITLSGTASPLLPEL